MTLADGSKLGPYEIVAPIGAGGMGEVYRALGIRGLAATWPSRFLRSNSMNASSANCELLLRRCLEKDPKKRLRDIGDMALLEASPEAVPAQRPWVAWGIAALFILITAALGPIALVHFREKPPLVEPVRFQIPLPEKTNLPASALFSLSPDGRLLAFWAIGIDGVTRLWVRPLDSLEARPLYGTENADGSVCVWSPDSRFIAFQTSMRLKKIDISGGPAQLVCNVVGTVVGGSWNRDGVIIFGSSAGGLMRVSAAGGGASALTKPDPSRQETYHAMPSFLPDATFLRWMGCDCGRQTVSLRRPGGTRHAATLHGSIELATGTESPYFEAHA